MANEGKTIKIRQVKSVIGTKREHREVIKSLGLRRIRDEVERPDTPAVRETGRLVVAVEDCPKPPPLRITLTLPAIQRSREVWLLVSGAGKADAVAENVRGQFLHEGRGEIILATNPGQRAARLLCQGDRH